MSGHTVVQPAAWLGRGAYTGSPVLALACEPRSDRCAPWSPLYDQAAVDAIVAAAVRAERFSGIDIDAVHYARRHLAEAT